MAHGAASYDQILTLLQRRRSIREFQDRDVEPHLLGKILAAARTALIGRPSSDVQFEYGRESGMGSRKVKRMLKKSPPLL